MLSLTGIIPVGALLFKSNPTDYADIFEKDDYWEAGIAQELGGHQVALLNAYYKNATNMLDDAQLLNTSIAQPYNFETGYAYGVEFSLKGQIISDWSDFFNYSYEIAKGKGISGGIFAFPPGTVPMCRVNGSGKVRAIQNTGIFGSLESSHGHIFKI